MTNSKKWIYKSHSDADTDLLQKKYGISRLTASVLQNRDGITPYTKDNDDEALIKYLYNPYLLKDMKLAVSRIREAVENHEKITIYGDYDADGVTSTAVLYLFLKQIGADVYYYIPDRAQEGYGMNTEALDKISTSGTSLVITVDTGISAAIEVSYAKMLGMDVIVTDHHECKGDVPDCIAVVNPKQSSCEYPFSELAGVGVVFKLICAIEKEGNMLSLIKNYAPLVCLGTIADVAPLVDENRIFATLGLKYFFSSGNKGIDALAEGSGLKNKTITSGSIGFILAPRINASGRLGNADKSVELFVCNDYSKAMDITRQLCENNTNRQNVQQQIFEEAVCLIEKNNLHKNKVIVAASENWHHGVIGIVASKITERYNRPSMLISISDGIGKGSGRSIHPFNLFEALTHSADCLLKFGGHCLAAGITIGADMIEHFSQRINSFAETTVKEDDFTPSVYIDAEIESNDIFIKNVNEISLLEPFGTGNPTPIFAYRNAQVKSVSTVSDGRHLKLGLLKDKTRTDAIGFNLGHLVDMLRPNALIDVAGTLDINCYNGNKNVQFIIKDIKIA